MMWDGSAWWWWLPLLGVVVTIVVVATVVAVVLGGRADGGGERADAMLAERFARGEVSAEEYRESTATLRAMHPHSTWTRVAVAVAVVVVAALLVAALFAAAGPRAGTGLGPGWMHDGQSRIDPESCRTPEASGQVVTVDLADMGAMMRGPTGRRERGAWQRGPMSATARPATVPTGEVWLHAVNRGGLVHELLVLPLAAGDPDGARDLTGDWTVSEEGAVGEATSNCRVPGLAEDEIAPGGTGSLSVDLEPGRYELLCNLPGHYAMGMHVALSVE